MTVIDISMRIDTLEWVAENRHIPSYDEIDNVMHDVQTEAWNNL